MKSPREGKKESGGERVGVGMGRRMMKVREKEGQVQLPHGALLVFNLHVIAPYILTAISPCPFRSKPTYSVANAGRAGVAARHPPHIEAERLLNFWEQSLGNFFIW